MSAPTPAEVREARGRLTQRECAAVLGVTIRTWQHYEAGTVAMRPEQLHLFCLAVFPTNRGAGAA